MTAPDGHVELFVETQTNHDIRRAWEATPRGPFTSLQEQLVYNRVPVDDKEIAAAFVNADSVDQRVHVFAAEGAGAVNVIFEVAGPSGTSWPMKPYVNELKTAGNVIPLRKISVALDLSGALELFALDDKGQVWQNQRPPTGYLVWQYPPLGRPGTNPDPTMRQPAIGRATAALDTDGTMVVAVRDAAGAVWYALQSSPGFFGFGGWNGLSGNLVSAPIAAVDGSGRISLYALGSDGNIQTAGEKAPRSSGDWVPTPAGWTSWSALYTKPSGVMLGPPVVAADGSGALHLFWNEKAQDGTVTFHQLSQRTPGDWSSAAAAPPTPDSNWADNAIDAANLIAVTREQDGTLISFRIDSTGQVRYQRPGVGVGLE
jgi:hypothetical protein